MQTLTFEDNKLFLIDGASRKEIGFKQAGRLRHLADEKTEKILKRVFVTYYKPPALPPLNFLDPHQKAGIEWILTRSRSYLAHAPGAGKTAQAILAAQFARTNISQTLFIVPPTLTENWSREIIKWTGLSGAGLFAIVPETINAQSMNWSTDYIICPDSMLTKGWVYSNLRKRNFHFIAVDEASRFKEREAIRTIALFGGVDKAGTPWPGLIYRAKHVVLLDGSPMPNRSMELWAPTFAMAPETIDFMDQTTFGFKYCGATINDRGQYEFRGDSNSAALHSRLTKSFMHVVTEDKLNHPERLRKIIFMNQDPRTAAMKEFERKVLNQINLADIDETADRGDIATYRRELGLSKVKWAIKYSREKLKNDGEKILIFAWHRDVCELLTSELKDFNSEMVIGSTPSHDRENALRNFEAGKCRALVGNIGSIGRGHNIQSASRVIFVEYAWGDETNRQAEKRVSRMGRDAHLKVPCDYLCIPNSLDEIVLNSVMRKKAAVEKVIK